MATGQNAYFVGKPNPLMMRTGLRILGVHSEEAVMIGDRHFDMEGAHAAGIDAVGVTYGYGSREELEASGAAALAASPEELLALLP